MSTVKTDSDAADSVGHALDEAPFSMFHLKTAVTAGMGFVTDSYDLVIIGTALLLLTPLWHLSPAQVGLLASSMPLAAFLGAVAFGRIADIVGRKRVYGIEAMLMVVGAILTAVSPNFTWLLVARFILGLGIGGDYPVSATIMTEYANRRNRGRQVALMFSAATVGQVVALIVGLTLLAAEVDHDLAWRLMLGLGALPALAVLYSRRRMPESPRYTAHVVGDARRAASELNDFAAGTVSVTAAGGGGRRRLSLKDIVSNRRLLVTLLGTAGAWFALNVAAYGNIISQPAIVKGVAPHATLAGVTAINLILIVLFNVTGVVCSVLLMDRVSRKGLQISGFLIAGAALLAIGIIPGLTDNVVPFALAFGLASFGINFGPTATIMVLSAESFPVSMRSTGHGISAGFGKLGAYAGALAVPPLLAGFGLHYTEILAAGVYLVAIVFTLLIPESSGRSLDDIERAALPPEQKVASTPMAPGSSRL